MTDSTLRRELAVAALCFGASGLLLRRFMPPLGLALGLAAMALAIVSLRSYFTERRGGGDE